MKGKSAQEISVETVGLFEKTEAQLEGFFEEIGNLAKKKPDDAVNPFKLGFINQMLKSATALLGARYQPFPDFETFDTDAVPTTSDVVMMLSQYLRAMDKFRKDHTVIWGGRYFWQLPGHTHLTDEETRIRAKRPKDLA